MADEGQGPFGSDQQVAEDIEGFLVIDKRVERIPDGVFLLVLEPNLVEQFRIVEDRLADRCKFGAKVRLLGSKSGRFVRAARIPEGPIGQDKPDRFEGMVGIVDHTAAHAAGVVREHATDHGRVDARWIGTDFASERLQVRIDESSDGSGLHPDRLTRIDRFDRPPVPADIDEPAIGYRLTREAGPTGTKANGDPFDLRGRQDRLDLLLVSRLQDRLGDQQVRTCIIGKGIALPCLGEYVRTGPIEIHKALAIEELFDRV